jgi:hypothetical protein
MKRRRSVALANRRALENARDTAIAGSPKLAHDRARSEAATQRRAEHAATRIAIRVARQARREERARAAAEANRRAEEERRKSMLARLAKGSNARARATSARGAKLDWAERYARGTTS